MAVNPSYLDYVLEQLGALEPVRYRKMFGGAGIYAGDRIFAIITGDETLYFKVDDSNRADYEAAGMSQFENMPYYELPPELLEDPEALRPWLDKTLAVAATAKKR